MPVPLLNGNAYSWINLVVNIFGSQVNGIQALNYKESQEMENIYGAGERPVARGHGPITAEGSITLLAEELEALAASAPGGNLMKIPEFDIVASFVPEGGAIQTHILHNCRFTENSRGMSQGDKSIPVEIPLIISHITWKG